MGSGEPFRRLEPASDAVARGNQKVFAEIGAPIRALHVRLSQRHDLRCRYYRTLLLAGPQPGDPPNGQRDLRQAFTRYYQAFFTGGFR